MGDEPEWTQYDDMRLCGACMDMNRASASASTTRDQTFSPVLAAVVGFPLASCRARWEKVLFPLLCTFDACFEAALDAMSADNGPRVVKRASVLYGELTGGMVFNAKDCFARWRSPDLLEPAQIAKAVYLRDPPGATLDSSLWTPAQDTALCHAWMQQTTPGETAHIEMTPEFWRALVKGKGTRALRTMPWQACFYRWREIKRTMRATSRAVATKKKSSSVSGGVVGVGRVSEAAGFTHCWAILKSRPEFQSEAMSERHGAVAKPAPPEQPVKRGRGRPRKYPRVEPTGALEVASAAAKTNSLAQQSTVDGSVRSRALRQNGALTEGTVAVTVDVVEGRPVIETRDQAVGTDAIPPCRDQAVDTTDLIVTASQAVDTRDSVTKTYRDRAVDTQDLELAAQKRKEQTVQEAIVVRKQGTLDAANTKNELLEMQLGVQLFSQTLPTDPQGHEYFSLLRETLLRRARKRACEEVDDEHSAQTTDWLDAHEFRPQDSSTRVVSDSNSTTPSSS